MKENLLKTSEETLDGHRLNQDAAALRSCEAARSFIRSGNYVAARRALDGIWQRIGQRPALEGLSTAARGEVLLTVGALSGWIGSAAQVEGAQETAKNFITESISIFAELGDRLKQAEAHVDLGLCYWREGAFNEARAVMAAALDLDGEGLQRARALMNLAIIDMQQSRHNDALEKLREAAPIFNRTGDPELEGRNRLQLSLVYKKLFGSERREEYLDRAIIEGAEASYIFEQTGNTRYEAIVINNLAGLYTLVGKFVDANINLDRARRLFGQLGDRVNVARVDDQRAQLLLAQGKAEEAHLLAGAAVRALEQGEEFAVLAEALTTRGKAGARLRNFVQARADLERAAAVAQGAGDVDGAGLAVLTLIEEMHDRLTVGEMIACYERADALLERNNEREISERLRRAARHLIQALPFVERLPLPPGSDEPTLKAELRRYERLLIKRAMDAEGGHVTRAAKRLGIDHQTLSYKLSGDYSELRSKPQRKKRCRPLITKNLAG